jgi:hypothetical protein
MRLGHDEPDDYRADSVNIFVYNTPHSRTKRFEITRRESNPDNICRAVFTEELSDDRRALLEVAGFENQCRLPAAITVAS